MLAKRTVPDVAASENEAQATVLPVAPHPGAARRSAATATVGSRRRNLMPFQYPGAGVGETACRLCHTSPSAARSATAQWRVRGRDGIQLSFGSVLAEAARVVRAAEPEPRAARHRDVGPPVSRDHDRDLLRAAGVAPA